MHKIYCCQKTLHSDNKIFNSLQLIPSKFVIQWTEEEQLLRLLFGMNQITLSSESKGVRIVKDKQVNLSREIYCSSSI